MMPTVDARVQQQTREGVMGVMEEGVAVEEVELLSCGCCEVEQWDARVWRLAWQARVVW